jgi:hypothetical protein
MESPLWVKLVWRSANILAESNWCFCQNIYFSARRFFNLQTASRGGTPEAKPKAVQRKYPRRVFPRVAPFANNVRLNNDAAILFAG